MSNDPVPDLDPADLMFLSGLSMIAVAMTTPPCQHCCSKRDMVGLSSGHAGLTAEHQVGCPDHEDSRPPVAYDHDLIERLFTEEQAAARQR